MNNNMDNNINDILKKLTNEYNNYYSTIEKRDMIIKEIKDLSNLLNDTNKYINDLQKQYKYYHSKKIKNEIDDYIKQKNDYISLINEYAIELNDLKVYDTYKDNIEFFELAKQFQDITQQLKKIEKTSKKLDDRKSINSNIIETVNAEGRKKYISKDLINEYEKLSAIKKSILPTYKTKYNEYISKCQKISKIENIEKEEKKHYYNNIVLGIAPNYIVTEEKYNKMSNQEKIDLENKYYNDMKKEEKISYCEDIINRIVNAKNTGKKEYLSFDSNHYYVPIKMKGIFYENLKKLKQLKTQTSCNKILNIEESKSHSIIPVTSNIISKKQSNSNIYALPEKHQESEPEVIYCGNYLKNGKIYTVDFSKQELDEEEKIVFASSNSQKKHAKKYKITNCRKPKNRKRLLTKIIAATLALAAGLTIIQSIKSLLNDKKYSVDTKGYSILNEIKDDEVPRIIEDNKGKPNPKKDKEPIIEREDRYNDYKNIRIGDIVTTKEGAPIFSNVYDAMTKAHAKKAYFSSNKQRSVLGIFIKCNHKFFYCENQQEVDNLLEKGGTIKSYVIGDGGYEGAFYKDDLIKENVKKRIKR